MPNFGTVLPHTLTIGLRKAAAMCISPVSCAMTFLSGFQHERRLMEAELAAEVGQVALVALYQYLFGIGFL
jgi:hypothetical protein